DAGMISEANQKAIFAARLSFILGTRIPYVPQVISEWRDKHPGQQIPDGQVFTQPWPATTAEKARGIPDRVIYYQYRHDREEWSILVDRRVTRLADHLLIRRVVRRVSPFRTWLRRGPGRRGGVR